MKPDFEDFLKAKHSETYMGTDDDMPDKFEEWLLDQGIDGIIGLANEYANMWAEAVLFKMSPHA